MQIDAILVIEFGDAHMDPVAGDGGDDDPGDIGGDRQLASTAVDQHREQDPLRPAEVGQLVECGTDGSSGE